MNKIQTQLYQLSQNTDLLQHSIRSIGKNLIPGEVIHPETVKYHWKKLYAQGLISYLPESKGRPKRISQSDSTKLGAKTSLVTIPVYGQADCGPATKIAQQDQIGALHISSSLLPTRRFASLYALRATGSSMNRASVRGRPIQDGDYVVIDSEYTEPKNGDYVVAVVGGLANIKRFYRESDRIALLSESSEDYDPIFIHPEDQSDNLINGKVVQVVEKPNF
ncbi:hypothetical protein EOM60_00280 [Candidatus Saccharibacteria bacterium]|nr:hypothetical protein [Candidatus Saccharibacteria bacterium]